MAFKEGVVLGTVSLNATGSGTTAIGSTSNTGTISIGNTLSGAVSIDCGTAGITVGGTANNHTTTLGTTNGTATTNIRAGSGGIGLTGVVTSANAITVTSGNVTLSSGNLALPNTTSTVGQITLNGTRLVHAFGTASGNVFIGGNGFGAGNFTTTAVRTVGLGGNVMPSLTNGSDNTGLGVNALFAVTGGGGNTAVGTGTLTNLTTGASNIAIGRNLATSRAALDSLLTGSRNIAIGAPAGSSYTGAESDNIVIGNAGTTGESNVMRLGTAGSGAGQINTTFIAGPTMNIGTDAIAGTVTIGRTTTTSALNLRYGTGDFTLASATGTVISALDTGEVTMALQPAFLAYNSATDTNQTGNGATVTVDFDTEVYDQNSDFSADTFTAPVTGRYNFETTVEITSLTAAMTTINLNLVTSNRTYQLVSINPGVIRNVIDNATFSGATYADMDATDTAVVQVVISGAAGNTAGIIGSASPLRTYFSGKLVA